MGYLEWYLSVGFVIAFIFACFFTKMLVLKKSLDKGESSIIITSEKSVFIFSLSSITVVLADVDDEFAINGFNVIFQLKLGLLFLINILVWPISLFTLILSACGCIFGQRLSTSDQE